MSTFGGKIKEIPGISVDRFDEKNLDSDAYFLSHCHMDHMVGLNTPIFKETLKNSECLIYVSHVTKAILKQLHPDIEDRIKELDFHDPTPINLRNSVISVIPIPSGHCPGSVMFLFEAKERVLYTGDFRIKPNDLKKIKAFYDTYGKLKQIQTIYLDTTFFLESYMQFPSREESLNEIVTLIKEWIALGEKHIIHLNTSARYGYEYVFMDIFEKLGMAVHINRKEFEFYSLIPRLDGAVSLDDSKTSIHCNCGNSFNKICKNKDEYNIRTIKLSAMRWKNEDLEEGITSNNPKLHYVCYSTHASYTEGVELIKFLKPQDIEPCVLRFSEEDDKIYGTIKDLLKTEEEPSAKKPKLFDLKKVKDLQESRNLDREKQGYDEIFDEALDSP